MAAAETTNTLHAIAAAKAQLAELETRVLNRDGIMICPDTTPAPTTRPSP